jgi:hypothetical protein
VQHLYPGLEPARLRFRQKRSTTLFALPPGEAILSETTNRRRLAYERASTVLAHDQTFAFEDAEGLASGCARRSESLH